MFVLVRIQGGCDIHCTVLIVTTSITSIKKNEHPKTVHGDRHVQIQQHVSLDFVSSGTRSAHTQQLGRLDGDRV